MKPSYLLPSTIGSLFFFTLLWLDLETIQHSFESSHLTSLIGVCIVLQAAFVAWYAYYCKANPSCTKNLKIMLKRFCWVFLGLSITSLTSFIFGHLAIDSLLLTMLLKLAFIVMFLAIIIMGIGLIFLVINDDSQFQNTQHDQGLSFQYGSAGYKNIKYKPR